jgi:hypothetical protein
LILFLFLDLLLGFFVGVCGMVVDGGLLGLEVVGEGEWLGVEGELVLLLG